MNYKGLVALKEICFKFRIKNIVHSPGSRSAPLILTFASDKRFKIHTFLDERSAGFAAIGIAQQTKLPTILICTSGTATLNFSPAICEAFYSNIPLIILTADRPKELLNQRDGQTINQKNIYKNFSKGFYELPIEKDSEKSFLQHQNIIFDAIKIATSKPMGPVHINAPFREPFYPENINELKIKSEIYFKDFENVKIPFSNDKFEFIFSLIEKSSNTLILAGQNEFDKELINVLNKLSEKFNYKFLTDITSNLHAVKNTIQFSDLFLMNPDLKLNKIDLLLSFGRSVLSKNLKTYLRNNKPNKHFHFEENNIKVDTFKTLTKQINLNPIIFFQELLNRKIISKSNEDWNKLNSISKNRLTNVLKNNFTELSAVETTLKSLPNNSNLHLANSMAVRWANFIGLKNKTTKVFSNRGTSGIDGCISTAFGHAKSSTEINTIIIGDLAFHFDKNAYLTSDLPKNIRIIVLNNSGGGIFNLISGPNNIPALQKYFTTPQKLTAEFTAKQFNFEYFKVKNQNDLDLSLKGFFAKSKNGKIIEIFTSMEKTKTIFLKLKKEMQKHYAK